MDVPKKLTNQTQRRHLRQRIEDATSRAASRRYDIQCRVGHVPPAKVTAALKTLKIWESVKAIRIKREVDALGLSHDAVRAAQRAVEAKLHFATPDEALAAVEKFEAQYP